MGKKRKEVALKEVPKFKPQRIRVPSDKGIVYSSKAERKDALITKVEFFVTRGITDPKEIADRLGVSPRAVSATFRVIDNRHKIYASRRNPAVERSKALSKVETVLSSLWELWDDDSIPLNTRITIMREIKDTIKIEAAINGLTSVNNNIQINNGVGSSSGVIREIKENNEIVTMFSEFKELMDASEVIDGDFEVSDDE